MDLLGRKSRRLLEQVVTRAEQLQELANGYKTLADRQEWVISELSARLGSRESLVRDLILENKELNRDLANALFQAAKPAPKPTFKPSEALHMSEEEQELRWREEQGLIKKDELAAMLEQLDFENTEIDLDPDYAPRPGLTY